MKKIFAILSVALLTVTACQKAVEIIDQTGVSLDQSAKTLIPGEYFDLAATITPANATSNYLTWNSSDTKIATVTNHGAVTAVGPNYKEMGPGKATITATTVDGKVSAKCEVTVNPIKVTGVTLNKQTKEGLVNVTSTEVYEFEKDTIIAVVAPANASYKDSLVWESADTTIAKVKDGIIEGVKAGETKVTVTTKDGGFTANCAVKVNLSKNLKLWTTDAAGTANLDGGKAEVSADWLKYKDGVVSWEENKTGKIRTATIVITESHASATITQGEAKDIVSKLAFYNYSFKAFYADTFGEIGKTQKLAGDRKHKTAVQLVAVEEPKDLNGHVHNMDIVGLYYDAKVPVSVEFSPEGCKFFTYLSDDYQHVNTGSSYVDVAIITQLTNSVTYGSNVFAPLKFGVEDCNHAWVEWGFDVESGKVTLGTPEQRLVTEGLYFCGFSIVTKGYSEGAYTTIYQLNYQNKWTPEEGAYFERF